MELTDGPPLGQRIAVPAGAAGHPLAHLRAVARTKLLREAARYGLGGALAGVADELLDGALDTTSIREILSRCDQALSRPTRGSGVA